MKALTLAGKSLPVLAMLLASVRLLAAELSAESDAEGVTAPVQAPQDMARTLGVSDDDTRPPSQLRLAPFGMPMTLGGELEAAGQIQDNYDLDAQQSDQRIRTLPELKLEARLMPTTRSVAFVQAKAYQEAEVIDQSGSRSTLSGWSLDQAWLLVGDIGGAGTALQVGRQKFQDRREWWWDEDMEAVRFHFANTRASGFAAVAERLTSGDSTAPLTAAEKSVRHLLGTISLQLAPRAELGLFYVHSSDHSDRIASGQQLGGDAVDETDSWLTWFGARYRARHKLPLLGKVYFTIDSAFVDGDERNTEFTEADDDRFVAGDTTRRDVRGWAVDAAASWEMPFEVEPYLTLGYARGSGGNGETDRDRDFRQTGLHGNNGKYRGISRFRYYGEALRPDLVNLRILTLALGLPLGEYASLETVYHEYRQLHARDDIPGSRLDRDPLGIERNLGSELDLILSFEYEQRWEAELSLGAFRAGPAYGSASGTWARAASFKLNFNF